MCTLIRAVNTSLFPDADPSSITWTGPPVEIITTRSLLYASLATSLFAAFPAMLGKQWVDRYIRNREGSATDGGSRMDSRSDTSSPSLKSFQQCPGLHCRCPGSPRHGTTGPSAAPSPGSSLYSRFRGHRIHPLHIRCNPPLRLPLSDT